MTETPEHKACRTRTFEENVAILEATWKRAMNDWAKSWAGVVKK